MKLVAFLLALLSLGCLVFLDPIVQYYEVTDFYNYWILTQQFLKGENPYDLQKVLTVALHDEIGPAHFGPWAFTLLLPILAWPFKISVFLYLLVTTSAWFSLSVVASKFFAKRTLPISEAVLSGLIFTPAVLTYSYGQWSILVALFGYLALLAYKNNKHALCGALLACATLKPHLAYLLWAALILITLRKQYWNVILGGVVTIGLLSGLAELLQPGVSMNWISSFSSSMGWKAASLVMPLRLAFATAQDPYPALPAIIIPLLAIWSVCAFFSRKELPKIWSYVPHLLALSCLTAPYIWPFDYSVLIGLHFGIFHSASKKSEHLSSYSRIFLLLSYAAFFLHFFAPEESLSLSTYWFPIAILYLWVRAKRIEPDPRAENSGPQA